MTTSNDYRDGGMVKAGRQDATLTRGARHDEPQDVRRSWGGEAYLGHIGFRIN